MEKTKRVVRSVFTYKPGLGRETPVGKSETVQGEAYTIAELMARAQQGSAPDITRKPHWQDEDMDLDDPDFEAVNRSDISEKAAYVTKSQEQQRDYQEAAEKRAKKLAEEADEAKRKEANKASDKGEHGGVRGGSEASRPGQSEKESGTGSK